MLEPGPPRKSPAKPSSQDLEKALNRTAEIGGVGVGALNLDALVPRRVVDLSLYGMAAGVLGCAGTAPSGPRLTLLATVAQLEARSIDDFLELLDLPGLPSCSARPRQPPTRNRHPVMSEVVRFCRAVQPADQIGQDNVALIAESISTLWFQGVFAGGRRHESL